MNPAVIAASAAVGAALSALVPTLIARVPEPIEPETDKETYADIAATPWLRWLAPLVGAVVGGLFAASLGWDWALIFLLPLIPVGIALAVIDWRTCLLPTRLIAPTYLVLVPVVVVVGLVEGEPRNLLRALIGWAVLGGLYFLLWLIHPRGMGYGDVRLSGILGIALGYLGWGPLVLGGWSGFLLGGVGGAVLALLKLVDRKSNPFGPWMLLGAVVGVVFGPAFGTYMWGI